MCLGIPAQIVRIDDAERMLATAEVAGVRRQVNIICILENAFRVQISLGAGSQDANRCLVVLPGGTDRRRY